MTTITDRKEAHLALSLSPDMRRPCATLPEVTLPYEADFPISDKALDTRVRIADRDIGFPLIIGCMTGGTPHATAFNTALRAISLDLQIGLGLGSIRACLENPALLETYGSGPSPWLFGNLGISEIMRQRYTPAHVRETLQKLGCHGLYIHFNMIQELLQPEGDHELFTDMDILSRFVDHLDMPVILKEVGSGIGGKCAERLARLNIRGLETASQNGTSWIRIEAERRTPPLDPRFTHALDAIGIPLKTAITDCRKAMKTRSVIASGGIEDPLTLIKSLALGADAVSIAQPIYAAYKQGGEPAARTWIRDMIQTARLIWRSTGAKNLQTLRTTLTSV